MNIGLANLDLYLPWYVVAILFRSPLTNHLLLPIAVILGRLLAFTVKLNSVRTSNVINDLFLHETIRCLDLAALIVVLRGGVDVVRSVANPLLPCEAPLDLVRLLDNLVMDTFNQATNQLVHVEPNSFHVNFIETYIGLSHPLLRAG